MNDRTHPSDGPASLLVRRLFGNIATTLVSILIVLAVVEIALRLAPSLIAVSVLDRMPSDLRAEIANRVGLPTLETLRVIPSAERTDAGPDIYAYIPNHTHTIRADPEDAALGAVETIPTDAKGFCNPPEKAERTQVDIVIIGDSFTYCSGVNPEQTAVALIETLTGHTSYNLGVGGIGPYEYVEFLKRDGLRLAPRIVVMNIYGGNDLVDIEVYLDYANRGEIDPGCGKRCKHPPGGILSYSYALAFLVVGAETLYTDFRAATRTDFTFSALADGERVELNVRNGAHQQVIYGERILAGELDPGIYEPPLAEFTALAREHNFIPVIAYLPEVHSAYQDTIEFADPAAGKAALALADAQRAWLAENADRIGYRFIDLVPVFRAAVAIVPLTHFPANNHFTVEGQRIAGEALAQELAPLLAAP